jgi:hypothetical protein
MSEYRSRVLALLGDRPVLESLAETAERIEALAARLDASAYATSYAPGKWTAAQILAHLVDAEWGLGFRLRQSLAEDGHTAQPFEQDQWVTYSSRLTGAQAARTFVVLRQWHLALLRTLTPAEFARSYEHPERGTETVDVLVRLLAGHDLNHLAQLERIANGGVV